MDIKLTFDTTITNLSGNRFGKTTYENQAKQQIGENKGKQIHFIFPANIENIASSFIQGFFEEIVEEIGLEGIEKTVDITAESIEDSKNYILRKLKY